jgi:ribosome-associated toxin RatA of RatAB toxin-antitoxin module
MHATEVPRMNAPIRPARFALNPCPANFLETAKWGWDLTARLPVTTEQAFDLVTDSALERDWFPNFRSARWASHPGVGATREYRLTYMRIVEEFTIWEHGQRVQFWVSSSSLPMLHRFLEDYRFNAVAPDETQVDWRIRYEPRRELRALRPILAPVFARDFRVAIRRLEALARQIHEQTVTGSLAAE